ncbi:hypothetical protein DFH28DRAFT_1135849 [Melampsora americana]|nr:hypothetical protein DFH28DRAFT_1135849 [Melampsora americana]
MADWGIAFGSCFGTCGTAVRTDVGDLKLRNVNDDSSPRTWVHVALTFTFPETSAGNFQFGGAGYPLHEGLYQFR